MTEEPEKTPAEDTQEPTKTTPEVEPEKSEPARVPHGQVLLAGGSTLTLAGAGVWSAWGPWGLAGLGAAGAVAGGAWLHHRYRRGKGEASRETRTTKSSGGSSGRSTSTRSGGTSAGAGKPGSTPGSGGPRSAGGSPRPQGQRPATGARPSGGRGTAGRPPSPRGPSKAPDSSTSTKKRKGGGMARGTEPGRLRRWLQRADDATGRRASTGWRAAKTGIGLRGRYRAAREALAARASGRPWINAGFAGVTAGLAGLWTLAGWARARTRAWADRTLGDPEGEEVRAESGAGPEDQQGKEESPDPGATQNIPRQQAPAAAPAATRGGTVGLPMAAIAVDMNGAAARYAPEDMWQVVSESREWPDVPRNVALAVRSYAQRLEADYPVNSAVTEKLQELYQALANAGHIAEEVEPLLRKAHEADIDRKEHARRGEEKWNV